MKVFTVTLRPDRILPLLTFWTTVDISPIPLIFLQGSTSSSSVADTLRNISTGDGEGAGVGDGGVGGVGGGGGDALRGRRRARPGPNYMMHGTVQQLAVFWLAEISGIPAWHLDPSCRLLWDATVSFYLCTVVLYVLYVLCMVNEWMY